MEDRRKKEIVAIIPARGSSKAIPKKNIMYFCGKPLISWTILQCKLCEQIDKIYVSSDSDEILNITEGYGAVSIHRPSELATDTCSSEDVLKHAIEHIQANGVGIDIVVFLQATSPLREPSDIDGAINAMLQSGADSLFTSVRLEDFFIWSQDSDGGLFSFNFDYQRRLRRQDVKPQWEENGSIYLFKPKVLFDTGNRLGGKIAMYEMEPWKMFEIDSLDDKELCEYYFSRRLLDVQRESLNDKYDNLSLDMVDAIVYDFDGVMTNNLAILMQDGTEGIMVNRADGWGIKMLKERGVHQVIISTESNPIVTVRAGKLGIEVFQNIDDKLAALDKYCRDAGFNLKRVVYVGNDLNDLEVMKKVGFPVATADAHPAVASLAKLVLRSPGGAGTVRELAEKLISNSR